MLIGIWNLLKKKILSMIAAIKITFPQELRTDKVNYKVVSVLSLWLVLRYLFTFPIPSSTELLDPMSGAASINKSKCFLP